MSRGEISARSYFIGIPIHRDAKRGLLRRDMRTGKRTATMAGTRGALVFIGNSTHTSWGLLRLQVTRGPPVECCDPSKAALCKLFNAIFLRGPVGFRFPFAIY